MRDVFEEMSLNGIRPNRRSYYTGLIACMRMRKLGDAMYFWEEMQRRGLEPDVRVCGRLCWGGGAASLCCRREGIVSFCLWPLCLLEEPQQRA